MIFFCLIIVFDLLVFYIVYSKIRQVAHYYQKTQNDVDT